MTPEQEVPTEDALFDNAVDGSEAAPVEQQPAKVEAPEPAAAEQRSEQQQPAVDPAAAKPDATAERQPVDDNAPLVPSWRLKEITEERRAAQAERDAYRRERDQLFAQQQEAQRRLAALEKPAAQPEAPDPMLDPVGYTKFMEKRWEERLVNERREFSLQSARKTYKEEFDQAYATAQQLVDPTLRFHMQRSADPGETLIAWFRDLKVKAEVGNDPAAYKKRVRDEALKDPEFRKAAYEAWREEAPAQTNGRPNVQLAPSLNSISRSSAALRSSQQDLSDDALFDNATS